MMEDNKILQMAKEALPELGAGDFVLALDAAEDGCLSAAYAVENGGLVSRSFEVFDDGECGDVAICDGHGNRLGDFSFLNNRIRDVDLRDARVVLVNVGQRNVVVEGGALKPGHGTAIVPIDPAEAVRLLGEENFYVL